MPTLKQPTPETIPIPPGHAFDGLPDVGRSPTTDAYKYTLICDCCEDRFTTEISYLAVLAGGPYQLTWTRHAKRPPFRHGRGASLASAQETQVPDFAYPDDGVRLETTEELLAELRLMLQGLPWWWHLAALGLWIGSVVPEPVFARANLLPWLWVWPVFLWSAMGTRESRFRTDQVLFSSPRPLGRQLPALWVAGFLVTIGLASGVLLRLLAAGDSPAVFAVAAAAMEAGAVTL